MVGTLLCVGMTIITTSTPAAAVGAEENLPPVAVATEVSPANPEQLQSLAVAATTGAQVERDGFTIGEVPKPPPPPPPEPDPEPEPEPEPTFASSGTAGLQWPVPHHSVSDPFGPRVAPCDGCSTFHKGMDIHPGEGAPIHAIADGVVVATADYDDGGLGVHAFIEHQIDGQTVRSTYAHMLVGTLLVSVGESVSAGQLLGNVGDTGQSIAPHLHFEIFVYGEYVDPAAWMAGHGL